MTPTSPARGPTSEASSAVPPSRRNWRSWCSAGWARDNAAVVCVLVAFDVSLLLDASIAARLYGAAFLLLVPGASIVARTTLRPREGSVRVAWSVGVSIFLLMILGLVYSYVLPHLGVARPLSRWPVAIGVDVVVLGSICAPRSAGDPFDYLFGDHRPSMRDIAIVLGLAALPLGAMAGAERLNNGKSGVVAMVVVLVVAATLLVTFLGVSRIERWILGLAIYSATLSVLLMSSMRSNYPYGYDIQSEFQVFTRTLHAGVWHVPLHGNAYAAMLSITVLPVVLAVTTHISGIYIFKVMYPVVFSLFPVMVLVVAERWFPRRAALVGAIVVVVQGLYAADITGIDRQQIGLVYFALFVVTAFDEHLPRRTRQVAITVAGIAMAVSHYSTAYFMSTIVIAGYLAFWMIRLVTRRRRSGVVLSLPVVVVTVGAVLLWNVTITRSAQDVGNLVSSIQSDGLQLVSGPPGSSLLDRFINADVSSSETPASFAVDAAAYYRKHAPWIHPFPSYLTSRYPIQPAPASSPPSHISPRYGNTVTTATTVVNELLLLLLGIGTLALLWRERRSERSELAELAAVSLGCIGLLGLLRLSSTISSLYNAPRGQVQGSPLLSVGLALVCTWLFTRRHHVGTVFVSLSALAIALLMFSDSGLASQWLGGGSVDTLSNSGDAYQENYFTDADVASARWVVEHDSPRAVVYADTFAMLQIYQYDHLPGIVNTILPQVLEPNAYVYASSANVVDHTARSQVGSYSSIYRYPAAFLGHVDSVVYSTGTTKVYR